MNQFNKKPYKILNLYACLGGNRYKWDDVIDVEVTSVELDPELCILYQERFPNDNVINGDAHKYLLDHYKEFDFIWTSPLCPSHSRARFWNASNYDTKTKPIYPDMTLYQEIIFLQKWFHGKYCVENVIPYYEPLIKAQKRDRHLYWTNFNLPQTISKRHFSLSRGVNELKRLCEFHDYDFHKYKGEQRINKIARNLVDYEAGKTILQTALNKKIEDSYKTGTLFNNI